MVGTLTGVAALFTVPAAGTAGWFRPLVASLLAFVGVCGLLGGLSGKPRPAGGLGSAAWLVAWVLVVHETLR